VPIISGNRLLFTSKTLLARLLFKKLDYDAQYDSSSVVNAQVWTQTSSFEKTCREILDVILLQIKENWYFLKINFT